MSCNKDKDDKSVFDNKVVINNYWDYFLIKYLGLAKPRVRGNSI